MPIRLFPETMVIDAGMELESLFDPVFLAVSCDPVFVGGLFITVVFLHVENSRINIKKPMAVFTGIVNRAV
jgi:hypothetical protein